MRIYLAGAEGYLPTCRQVKGENVGLLCSFFTIGKKSLRKMLKVLEANNRKEKGDQK